MTKRDEKQTSDALDEIWAEPAPMPPGGYDDPNYSAAIHGYRDEEHLRELVEQGFKSDAGQKCTPALLEEIRTAGRQRVGLGK